jgi:hypothetical protein
MIHIVSVVTRVDASSFAVDGLKYRGSRRSHESLRSRQESRQEGYFGESSDLGIG